MERTMIKRPSRRGSPRKVARLYHFTPNTVEQIDFLAHIFGGKEKGVAAAVDIAASVLKGEQVDLRVSVK